MKKELYLRGLIAEEICKFHLKRSGFNIINSGKEWFDKELANNLLVSAPKKSNLTLRIFNDIIAKLPDFMIWKSGDDEIDYKFVEVKYRKILNPKIFKKSIKKDKTPYIKYKCTKYNDTTSSLYDYIIYTY